MEELEKKIGYHFKDKNLLEQVFIHKSYTNESVGKENNERLEFLGDAILQSIVTDFLFNKFPDEKEGRLSVYRSALVDGEALFEVSKSIGLSKYILMSKGQKESDSRSKKGLISDACEALVGAIFLDGGYEEAIKFVMNFVTSRTELMLSEEKWIEPKTTLQEHTQSINLGIPEYRLVSEDGPDHDKKFVIELYIGGELSTTGTGNSKQEAQQDAAKKALKKM